MKMYRLTPVSLPCTLPAGEYVFHDDDGIALTVTLHHPMEASALANLVSKMSGAPTLSIGEAAAA